MAFYNLLQTIIVVVIAIYCCWQVMLAFMPVVCRLLVKGVLFLFSYIQALSPTASNAICQRLSILENSLQKKKTGCASCNACGKCNVGDEKAVKNHSLKDSNLAQRPIVFYKNKRL